MTPAERYADWLAQPAPGQECETCGQAGHLTCWEAPAEVQVGLVEMFNAAVRVGRDVA